MGKLTEEQQKQLEELRALEEAPDEPEAAPGKVLNVHVNLDDPAAVKLARKLGFLPAEEPEEEEEEEGDDERDPDEAPKRRAYFKDADK